MSAISNIVWKLYYDCSYISTINRRSIKINIKNQRLKGLLLHAVANKLEINSFKLLVRKKYVFQDAEMFRIYQIAAYI